MISQNNHLLLPVQADIDNNPLESTDKLTDAPGPGMSLVGMLCKSGLLYRKEKTCDRELFKLIISVWIEY